jgi:C1A family cysteine protease
MMLKLFVAVVLLVGVSAVKFHEKDVQFDKFMSYIRQHNKNYANMDEFALRFENFKASVTRIAERNARSDGRNIFGLNKFSDMSPEEFKEAYLGYKPAAKRPHAPVSHPKRNLRAPTSVDWRTKGAVTPVKNQAQCGSCWAFSTAEEIESQWFMAGNQLVALSEQQIVSCDTTDGGCNGGDTVTAYAYVQSAGGLESEAAYPYSSGGGTAPACSFDPTQIVANITGFTYATPPCQDACTNQDETTLANNLAEKGPVSICVYALPWQDYTGGVLTSDCTSDYSQLDHCVQLVGYNKDSGNNYWIIRNSWDTTWGEEGYIYVQIGSNLCGVADEATIATVASH